MSKADSLITGTVDLLVLQGARDAPTYAYRLAQNVARATGGTVQLKEGSLYPALQRLEGAGLLRAYDGASEAGRRRRYYQITPAGLDSLEEKRREWNTFSAAVWDVLNAPRHNRA